MENPPTLTEPQKKTSSKKREYLIGGTALTFTLALCVAVIVFWDFVNEASHYGYLGVFIISIFAGGTVIVPVPGLILVFTLGSVLTPAIVGVVSGFGEAIGSVTIYLTGIGGRSTLKTLNNGAATKFENWLNRRGSLTVFIMSAIINPLFYPFAAMAGMLRFGLIRFFIFCFIGKTVKNTVIAYLGYLGLGSLLRWIGIGV